jgi:hypothetical protein
MTLGNTRPMAVTLIMLSESFSPSYATASYLMGCH